MSKRIIITVDGLAGSGKTSLSKALAAELGYVHFSSGILYRSLAWLVRQNQVDPEDHQAVAATLAKHKIELQINQQNSSIVLIDDELRGAELHTPENSEMTSRVSVIAEVRAGLLEVQRNAFQGRNLVAEGRDMGTVVFPDAPLKFFIDVDVETRVARRLQQLITERPNISQEERNLLKKQMEIEIVERDQRDQERVEAPTVAATDAIIVDNSGQSLTQAVQSMYAAVASRGLGS